MKGEAKSNPSVSVQVRVITFDSVARWHVANPVDIESFKWTDVRETGQTAMGQAIDLLADAVDVKNMPARGLPPVAVLLSDGQPSDPAAFDSALERLMRQPWGARSVRISIAIGDDADLNVLQKFMVVTHASVPQSLQKNATDLVKFIKWASTVPLSVVARPASRAAGTTTDTM